MKTSRGACVVVGRLLVTVLLSVAVVLATAGGAAALPTAAFTFTPDAPAPGEPVSFRFTGTCDVPPCTISWRWFRPGGSTLGTAMGSGASISYAFPAPATYSVVARITNSTPTHGSATATRAVTVQGTFEDSDRRVGYDGWRGVTDPRATEGGYRTASSADAVVSASFTGTAVTYVGRTGPSRGIAAVSIAGSPTTLVDLYSPDAGSVSVPVEGLTDAAHRILIRPTGRKNPASTGTAVTVDELAVGAAQVDDRAPQVRYGSWRGVPDPDASGGSLRCSSSPGADTTFRFIGSGVTWLSVQGPRHGLAAVFVDGQRVDRVDGYAATRGEKVEHTYAGLTNGPHVVRVVVLGAHRPASAGDLVCSDAFVLG